MGYQHYQQHNSDATRCQYLTLMLQTINKWSMCDNMRQREGVRQYWIYPIKISAVFGKLISGLTKARFLLHMRRHEFSLHYYAVILEKFVY